MKGAMLISRSDLKFFLRQGAGRVRRRIVPVALPTGPVRRLHLGCGPINKPGFINIDGISMPHVHFVQGIARLARFADESVDFIYCSHALEHFPRASTQSILREWHRILRKGGRLCLSVPDFDLILAIYLDTGRSMPATLPPLFGGQNYPFNFHHTAFNRASLTDALLGAEFQTVQEWSPGCDAEHDMPDWSSQPIRIGELEFPISLNLEATK
jgi:SAM-dependent methyltransferase